MSSRTILRTAVRRLSTIRPQGKKRLRTATNETDNPWVEKADPNGSGQRYFWNQRTNETTHLGSPKPIHWIEVDDPEGSGQTYWWDPDTDATTPVGAPKPSIYRNTSISAYSSPMPTNYVPPEQPIRPMTLGSSMKLYFGLGLGMSMAFAVVGALFR